MKQQLLLLHGALGSKSQFDDIVQKLATKYQIYSFNFDGHGGNAATSDFSIELFAENTKNFMDQKGLQNIAVFGYSMGGYVALYLAKKHPELVGVIVTLGTKFDWNPESAVREVKMLNPEIIAQKVPAFATKLRDTHHPLDWKVVMRMTAQMMVNLGNGTRMAWEEFKEITIPVTIGIGNLDRTVSLSESEKVAAILPNGEFKILENCPHMIDQIETNTLVTYIQKSLQ